MHGALVNNMNILWRKSWWKVPPLNHVLDAAAAATQKEYTVPADESDKGPTMPWWCRLSLPLTSSRHSSRPWWWSSSLYFSQCQCLVIGSSEANLYRSVIISLFQRRRLSSVAIKRQATAYVTFTIYGFTFMLPCHRIRLKLLRLLITIRRWARSSRSRLIFHHDHSVLLIIICIVLSACIVYRIWMMIMMTVVSDSEWVRFYIDIEITVLYKCIWNSGWMAGIWDFLCVIQSRIRKIKNVGPDVSMVN